MMAFPVKCRLKPYIQPFERKLAVAEMSAITRSTPYPMGGSLEHATDFVAMSQVAAPDIAARVAYWEQVADGDNTYTSVQSAREATLTAVRNGVPLETIADRLPFGDSVPFVNRRCLRYGSHGIHEYRGKFFPQLVRSLINAAGVPDGGIVLDPMCGSGTTAVETILAGRRALALDLNPLSVFVARTKCSVLSANPEYLRAAYEHVRQRLVTETESRPLHHFETLPEVDQEYSLSWFPQSALADLDQIIQEIQAIEEGPCRDLLLVSLSNILRRVSWQKEADLRVRREAKLDTEIDPIREFLEESGRSVRTTLAFLYQHAAAPLGTHSIKEGDARVCADIWKDYQGTVDAVITSPPYATALPYLDTDRLSLTYLGFLPRALHRKRDQEMIGNREVTDRVRTVYWDWFSARKRELPDSVTTLIEQIKHLNGAVDVGFRRRNLPSLLAKYFFDMKTVFANTRRLLRIGGRAYVVVGDNHTIAGGTRIDINTTALLGDIATRAGFVVLDIIPMEMLVSRDIFRRNAVASESILCLQSTA